MGKSNPMSNGKKPNLEKCENKCLFVSIEDS